MILWSSAVLALSIPIAAQEEGQRIDSSGHSRSDTSPRHVDGLPQLHRKIRHFDFEERVRQPYDFPIGWYRVASSHGVDGAADEGGERSVETSRAGHPLFGDIRFSDTEPHEGRWCLQFELAGGSMTAAVAPNIVPIIPGSDYLITAWVRTAGLEHARARVAALFYDQAGRPVHESLAFSELLQTRGEWRQVAIPLSGFEDRAADIIVELQLLQPAQFREGPRDEHAPILEDVSGSAWFDDVTIWHAPRVRITTGASGNIIIAPQTPALRVQVRDLATEPLRMTATIENLAGEVLHQRPAMIERGRSEHDLEIDGLDFGWYRATVELAGVSEHVARTVVNFAYLPQPTAAGLRGGDIGVNLEDIAAARAPESAALARALQLSPVVLPGWDRTHMPIEARSEMRVDDEIEQLLNAGGEVILALGETPDELALELQVGRNDVLELFAHDEGELRPYLQDLLIAYGQRISRWQIGRSSAAAAPAAPADARAARAREIFSRLVPGATLLLPQTIDEAREITAHARVAPHIIVPYRITPPGIESYLEAVDAPRASMLLTLQPLPIESFQLRDRAIDLVMRGLHARRAGVRAILMHSPWRSDERTDALEPDPALPAWVQTARALRDMDFAAEIPIGRGMRAWLFESPDDATLVAWNETRSPDDARLTARLGDAAVERVDIDGNATAIPLIGGAHTVEVATEPIFIRGVDPMMLRFRSGFRIEPGFAKSIARDHVHEVVIANPWGRPIAGTIRFVEPASWSIMPQQSTFSIAPGEEARIPITLTFSRNEPSGEKRLTADVELATGDGVTSFPMAADFRVGLDYLELEPTWRLAPHDDDQQGAGLIVGAYITNTSDRPLSLEAFVIAPQYPRMRRTIAQLGPGETTLKLFHLPDGAERLGGRIIRLGVGEIDNPERLNRTIEIPALDTAAR